jgi:hypothetical protein
MCNVHTRTRNTLEDRGEFRLEMLLSESAGQLEFTEFRECDRCDLYSISLTIKYFPFQNTACYGVIGGGGIYFCYLLAASKCFVSPATLK